MPRLEPLPIVSRKLDPLIGAEGALLRDLAKAHAATLHSLLRVPVLLLDPKENIIRRIFAIFLRAAAQLVHLDLLLVGTETEVIGLELGLLR